MSVFVFKQLALNLFTVSVCRYAKIPDEPLNRIANVPSKTDSSSSGSSSESSSDTEDSEEERRNKQLKMLEKEVRTNREKFAILKCVERQKFNLLFVSS